MKRNPLPYLVCLLAMVFSTHFAQGAAHRKDLSSFRTVLFQTDTVPKDSVKKDSIKKDTAKRAVIPIIKVAQDTTRKKVIQDTTVKKPAQDTTVKKVAQDTTVKPITQDTTAKKAVQDTTVKPAAQDIAGSKSVQDSISGKVSDSGGPLIGVVITVKGGKDKSLTDSKGQFKIAAGDNAILLFAYMGYKTKQEPVNKRKTINVVMATESKVLSEVQVVATGYGTVNRSKLTSSVSSIQSDQIKNDVMPTITQAIQGKAGGVQVTQKSGSPGGGLNIRIRGTTSINAGSDPLYVVDGIPVNSTTNFTGGSNFNFGGGTQGINILASINPSDVQSVEILKDAASSSIYGARAANGVVLITTKKGQPGTSTFSFNAYEGFSEVPNERKYKMMNTGEYQDYMKDYYKYLLDANGNPTPVPAQVLANPNINTDWQKQIFRTAPTRNYELSARGGSEKTQYYTSIGYMRQGGVIQNSNFSRLSARINLDHQHSDKLKFSARVNLTRALNDRVQEENSKEGSTKTGIFAPPNLPVYNPDGSYAYDQVNTSRENPVAMLLLPVNNSETFRVLASGSAEYKFMPELTLKTSFGADLSYIDETFFMPPNGIRSFAAQGGIGAQRNTRDQLWINETTLSYQKSFGEHHIDALAGASVQQSRVQFVDASRSNFPSNDIEYISAGGLVTGANSFPEEWSIASGFSRVNYDYKGKYLLTANFRVDGSSRFGTNSRYATFPSFGAAWRASDEDFLKSNKVISNLKVRASWGITGNQNIPNYASYSLYSGSNNYMGNPGYLPNVLGDKDLKWETTKQLDFGVDVGLFNNRISILADYYIKNTSDLLVGVVVPTSSGFANRFTNVGKIQNKGFEFELTTQNLVGAFKWSTSLNMSFNRNKVVSLPGGELSGGVGGLNIAREGLPLGSFYGWKMSGVNPQTGMIDYIKQDGSLGAPNDPKDRGIIGNPNPDFYGGITNTFTYKNFDLSIMGQFSYGNDVFNYNLASGLDGSNKTSNGFADWNRRWRNPGDITDIPRPTPGNFDNTAISDRFVQDGSFFRLRNITFGYTLSDKVSEKLKIKSLRVYTTVQNAFVFTKYKGYDPEVSSSHGGANAGLTYGYDYGSYPQPRIFTAGINLTF